MRVFSTSTRRLAACVLAFSMALGACSSTVSGQGTRGLPDGLPGSLTDESRPIAVLAVEALPAGEDFAGGSSVFAMNPATPATREAAPETEATADEQLAWDWRAHASAPIAQFDAVRVVGEPVDQPTWTAQFLQISEDEAVSCVDGSDYRPTRTAFRRSNRATFVVNGQLWQFTVLDPRTYPLAATSC